MLYKGKSCCQNDIIISKRKGELRMFTVFFKHKFLSAAIFGLLCLSIICQIMLGVIFHKLIKDADNMPTTENKLLKQCKLKFINCYKLNGGILNTSVFVDKFISRIHIMGISLVRLSHLAGQLMMMSVFVTGISICVSLAGGDTLFQIIPYYLVSILGLYLYFSISGIVDISGKKNLLKTNLVDYLENHLLPRLELEREAEKNQSVGNEEVGAARPKTEDSQTPIIKENAGKENGLIDYADELEDLLKEFLA